MTPSPPRSSQPSRPRPTPRASRPPRTRAPPPPPSSPFRPVRRLPDPNAASPKTARIWSKAEPRIWSRALHSGGQRFRARATPSPAARAGTSPVLVGDSDHLFVHGVSVRPREDEARALHPQRRHRRVLRSFRDGVQHARRVQIFLLEPHQRGRRGCRDRPPRASRDRSVRHAQGQGEKIERHVPRRARRPRELRRHELRRVGRILLLRGMLAGRRRRLVQPRVLHPGPRLRVRDELPVLAHAARGVFPRGRHRRGVSRARRGPDDRRGDAARRRRRRRRHGRVPPRVGARAVGRLLTPRRREHHHASAPRGDPHEVSRRARVWRVRLDGRGRRDGRLRRRGLRRRVGVDVRRARDVFKRRPRTSSNPRRRPRDVVGRVRDARAFRERVRGARRPVVRSRRGRGRDGSVSRPVVLRVIRGENRPRVDPGLRRSAHVVARRPVGSEVFSSRGDQDVSRGRSRRSERDRSRPVDGGRRVVVARTGRDAVDRRHGARRSGARVGRLGVHQGRRAQRHVRVRRRRR